MVLMKEQQMARISDPFIFMLKCYLFFESEPFCSIRAVLSECNGIGEITEKQEWKCFRYIDPLLMTCWYTSVKSFNRGLYTLFPIVIRL